MPFGRKHPARLRHAGANLTQSECECNCGTSKALAANITTATVSVRWIIADMSDDPRKISKRATQHVVPRRLLDGNLRGRSPVDSR
jgi:hypothetical protein